MTDAIEVGKRSFSHRDDYEFEPTMELRIFQIGEVLQQRWRKPRIDSWGLLVDWDYEWRAVPHVYGEDFIGG